MGDITEYEVLLSMGGITEYVKYYPPEPERAYSTCFKKMKILIIKIDPLPLSVVDGSTQTHGF